MQDFKSFFISIIFILIGLMFIIVAFKSAILSFKKNTPYMKELILSTLFGLTFILLGLLNYLQVISISEFLKNIF